MNKTDKLCPLRFGLDDARCLEASCAWSIEHKSCVHDTSYTCAILSIEKIKRLADATAHIAEYSTPAKFYG